MMEPWCLSRKICFHVQSGYCKGLWSTRILHTQHAFKGDSSSLLLWVHSLPPTPHFLEAGYFLRQAQIQHAILLLPGQSFLLVPPWIYTLSFQIHIIFQHKVSLSFTLMVLEGWPQVTSSDSILFRDVTSSVFKHSLERKNLHATLPCPPPKVTTRASGWVRRLRVWLLI